MKGKVVTCLLGVVFLFGITVFQSQAEMVSFPDKNTLWEENWSTVEGWRTGQVEFDSEGGLTTLSKIKGTNGSTGQYVKWSRDYPYLQMYIQDIEPIPGYKGLVVINGSRGGRRMVNMGGSYLPGIWTFDVLNSQRFPGDKDGGLFFLRMDFHGGKFVFDWIKMVKIPQNAIVVETVDTREKLRKGDKFKIKVFLDEPAIDVTVDILSAYLLHPVSLNGEPYIQLRKSDKEGRKWEAEVTIEAIKPGRISNVNVGDQGRLIFRANILGGKIKNTYTSNPWTIEILKE